VEEEEEKRGDGERRRKKQERRWEKVKSRARQVRMRVSAGTE